MENKACPQCGSQLEYKEGFSKARNKPWAGYFCSGENCKYVNWLRPGQATPAPAVPIYQTQPSQTDKILEAVLDTHKIVTEIYKLDVAIYKILKNDEQTTDGNGSGDIAANSGKGDNQ